MGSKNLLLTGGLLFIVLLSTIANAEGDKKNISSVIPSENIQKDEVIHIIKLEDILEGKYSKEKKTTIKLTVDNDVVADKVSPDVEKSVVTDKPIDMKEAFAAVMGSSNEPVDQHRVVPQQKAKQQVAKPVLVMKEKSTGWLYLGKFSQGQWDQKNNQVLGLNGTLPESGRQYLVRVFSNVRQGYPSKKGMPPIVKVLPQGSKVKLLGVHNSGKTGHYWANVQWF